METVSIIVPVYNTVEFVGRCIESIICQEYLDWELILIDDGSTDGSAEICDKYASVDNRIKVVHTPNRGVSAARNTGLDYAHGKWVCFVDSDDHVSPTYISDMLRAAGNSDIVVSGWIQSAVTRRFPDIVIPRAEFLSVFVHNAFLNICGKLILRETMERAGLRFDEKVRWAEDSIFFVKVLLHSHKVTLISETNYYYNLRDNTAVGRLNPYDNELAGFNAINSLMPRMISLCTPESRKYFSPYLFLVRTLQAVRNSTLSKKEKVRLMSSIKFDKRYLFVNTTTLKEKIISHLVLSGCWRILLSK